MPCEKYVFIGSHGTGKSSAATYLASILKQHNRSKSVKVIEENIREVSRIFLDKINTPSFQKLCMVDHLRNEFMSEQLYDLVVCDRTAIDTLVYGLVYDITLPAEYFSLAIDHLDSFEHVFFVRPDKFDTEIADDGFRDTDLIKRKEVDYQFEKMLKLWGGRYTEVKTSEIFDFPYIQKILEK